MLKMVRTSILQIYYIRVLSDKNGEYYESGKIYLYERIKLHIADRSGLEDDKNIYRNT